MAGYKALRCTFGGYGPTALAMPITLAVIVSLLRSIQNTELAGPSAIGQDTLGTLANEIDVQLVREQDIRTRSPRLCLSCPAHKNMAKQSLRQPIT